MTSQMPGRLHSGGCGPDNSAIQLPFHHTAPLPPGIQMRALILWGAVVRTKDGHLTLMDTSMDTLASTRTFYKTSEVKYPAVL